MRPGGGKNKGSDFERLICRRLSKWIQGSELPELFWRSASSGAKATMDHRRGKIAKMYGDIIAIDEKSYWFGDLFVIECKFYKEFDFGKMLQKKGKILEWWEQVCRDAELAGKFPFLIFKRNQYPIYVMYNLRIEEIINDLNYSRFKFDFYVQWSYYSTISLLEDWLNFLDPEMLRHYSSYLS